MHRRGFCATCAALALATLYSIGCGPSPAQLSSGAAAPVELVLPPSRLGAPEPKLAADEPESRRDETQRLPFVGTWVSEDDGSLIELSATSFHHRFPYMGAPRDLYARVTSYNTERGHIAIEYTRILQDGVEESIEEPVVYMRYEIRDGDLYKHVDAEDFPTTVDDERFVRTPGRR
ncbi:hypothetical protein WME73_00435 [Sorangium sp. So ce302]|uniref:hypothetical protein n=1 Tax=Sorangium sp. So ce302 TaxID=3133297 RepID=UPI003F5E6F63